MQYLMVVMVAALVACGGSECSAPYNDPPDAQEDVPDAQENLPDASPDRTCRAFAQFTVCDYPNGCREWVYPDLSDEGRDAGNRTISVWENCPDAH